jgi:hypothetical protein
MPNKRSENLHFDNPVCPVKSKKKQVYSGFWEPLPGTHAGKKRVPKTQV